jgi:flagellar hook-length control protein FliK
MSELMINATPTPPPSGAGNANALGQSDAASRAGESGRTDGESGAESPFAAVLKSKTDTKPSATDTANTPRSSVAEAQSDAEDKTNSLDLTVFFPLLTASLAGPTAVAAAPVAATEPLPDQPLLPALEATTSLPPAQILAALPAAPTAAPPAAALPVAPTAAPTAAALPVASAAAMPAAPAAAPPVAPTAALPVAPGTVMDTAPRKQEGDARNQTFTAAAPAKPGGTSQISGKIAFDAAINADAGHISGESIAPELPAGDFRALMERAMTMAPGATGVAGGSSSTPSLRVDTPLGQTGWHEEMGQKLTWMVGNNRQQADLVLNPPQLGRIEVSLTMNGDQATAIFTSPNPAVREALENSLHRLREVLADAGVSLGQAQVGSESPHQSSAKNEPDFGMNESVRYASAIPLPAGETIARSGAGRSMIDIFA